MTELMINPLLQRDDILTRSLQTGDGGGGLVTGFTPALPRANPIFGGPQPAPKPVVKKPLSFNPEVRFADPRFRTTTAQPATINPAVAQTAGSPATRTATTPTDIEVAGVKPLTVVPGATAIDRFAEDLGIFGSPGQPGTVVETDPAPFAGVRGTVTDKINELITSGGPSFEGDFAAGLSPEEMALLDQIFGASTATPAGTAASQDLLQRTIGGDFLSPDSNPLLAATIKEAQRPVLEAFRDSEIPGLRAAFTRAGQRIQPGASSPFEAAELKAGSRLADTLAGIGTNIAGQNFQAERTRQQQAAELAPKIDEQQFKRLVDGLREQALPRLIEQLGLDKGLAEFERRTQALLQALQLGVTAGAQQPQTAVFQPQPGTPGILGEILGGAGGGVAKAITGGF